MRFEGSLRAAGVRAAALLLALAVLASGACQPTETRTPLRVFIAGSLVVPFADLEREYEAQYPEVDVQVEAHGSIQVIRHVTEIHDLIDVVVPADYALIPLLMYNSTVAESGEPYADWTIQFASNRLVLAYTDESASAGEVSADNWYQVLARPEVLFGLSDPRLDSAGYRVLMVMQLAEDYYNDPTIFERVFLGRFKEPLQVEKSGSQTIVHVPELLETSEDSNIRLRGGSVALLALLESGDIDYAFEYESVARQHGLRYVELPPELNLGAAEQAERYASIQVQLDFQRFSSVEPLFSGERIGYGVTIPANAPQPQAAQEFVAFLLGPQGAQIMARNSHPVYEQPRVDAPEALPASLQPLAAPGMEISRP